MHGHAKAPRRNQEEIKDAAEAPGGFLPEEGDSQSLDSTFAAFASLRATPIGARFGTRTLRA
jgi:hypothetical protein